MKKPIRIFLLLCVASLGLFGIRAEAQSSETQGALDGVKTQVESLVVAKDEAVIQDDLGLRIETFRKVVEFSIGEAKGLKIKLLGVEDLIIVENGDAILVARKDRAQDIRRIVEEVKRQRPDLT